MDPLTDPAGLTGHILHTLGRANPPDRLFRTDPFQGPRIPSSVLVPIGPACGSGSEGFDPCLILNKRSRRVRQPGDLCCPGGSVSPAVDTALAKVLTLPLFPLRQWPRWSLWRRHHPDAAGHLALLLATCLRESFEEMRLNPLGVRFLGPLFPQRLVMFEREIHPMVGWVGGQRRFRPNWEVEKIVHIPLKTLLDPERYAAYHLDIGGGSGTRRREFPCFLYQGADGRELLWGVTFRIIASFLESVFGFRPPDPATLPAIPGSLSRNYFSGSD